MSNNINEKKSNVENSKKMNLDLGNQYGHTSTKEKDKAENKKSRNKKLNKDPIYIMTLELEKGKPEKIKIYPDSDPMQIASNFCKEHNLDYNGLDYLRNKIETLLNQNNISLLSKKKEEINTHKLNNNLTHNNTNEQKHQNCNNIKTYDLTSPKQNAKNKINNFNKERKFNLNNKSSSKKNHKCKARIKSNQNSDKIFDKIYSEIKSKNNQNDKKENNLEKRNNKTTNNYNEYKDIRNKKLKIEREKEIFEIKKEINKRKNKNISKNKNCRKCNYSNLSQFSKYDLKKVDYKITKILKEYDEKYSFHPNINENYKTDLTFEQRQEIYKNIYKKRKEELKNYYLSNKKDEKGNLLFKPKLISRSTYEENKTTNENIFNKNYYYWKKYNLDKEELFKKYYNKNNNEPMIFAKKQNERIINETRIRAFKNLFNDLDGDQDNYINSININTNKIPKSVFIIIEPLLNELKIDNQSLNEEEFVIAMNKLFKDISSIDRRTIINIYSNNKKIKRNISVCNSFLNDKIKYRYLTPDNYNKNKANQYTNNNTNKLAFKHYKKIRLMFDVLYKMDNKKNNYNKNKKEKKGKYFGIEPNDDENFNYICNCTFNNYIKKLN